ncbi:MAG: hypothetical protein ACYC0M_15720 [Burkholderiales bacterium]
MILDVEAHGEIVETIEAATWMCAREQVTTPVAHDEGRGFILL